MFAPDAFWNTPLPEDAPLDPTSDAVVAYLCEEIALYGGSLGRNAVSIYEATSEPLSLVTLTPGATSGPVTAPGNILLYETFANGVPIPPAPVTSGGNDHSFVVLSEETDEMWELFELLADPTTGGWTARWGGYKRACSTDPGWYRNVFNATTGLAIERPWWGVTGCGLPLPGGVARIAEVEAGLIPHALSMCVRWARAGVHSSPAQRQDGRDTNPAAPVEGSRFRLDPTLDFSTLPAPLPIYCAAAQTYGIVVDDQTGQGITLRSEGSQQLTAELGYDPWLGPKPYFGPDAILTQPNLGARFPWEHLQLMPMQLRTTYDMTKYYA